MATWADEISAIIEKNIAGFGTNTTSTSSVGTVIAFRTVLLVSMVCKM